MLSGGTQSGGTILSGGILDILTGGVASGITVGSGGTEIVLSGGEDVSGTILKGGAVIVSSGGTASGTTVSGGGQLIVAASGTAIITGTVTNPGGTLFARGPGSLVEITSGAVVNGGVVEVGNGIVDVKSGGTANVTFLSTGTGGLEIEDTQANPTAYSGVVSGFGGVSHANHTQFIDLTSVTYTAGETVSYSANGSNTGGVLTVSSGGTAVAEITLVGTYKTSNFHISSGISGTVEITDPSVAEQPPGNAPATIAGGTCSKSTRRIRGR